MPPNSRRVPIRRLSTCPTTAWRDKPLPGRRVSAKPNQLGWVSAVARLLRPGSTLQDAESEFALGYLFARYGDGKVMAEHLDQYRAWLAARGGSHSPERFRLWVNEGFRPGRPSREDWPYDPYPLVVVTRPAGAVADAGAGGVRR